MYLVKKSVTFQLPTSELVTVNYHGANGDPYPWSVEMRGSVYQKQSAASVAVAVEGIYPLSDERIEEVTKLITDLMTGF